MFDVSDLYIVSLYWLVPSAIAVYLAYNAVSNLFWHPLAAFPGPSIATISALYKAYIDLVSKTSFVHRLDKLQAQYGM
jgi:hypothetical protein